MDKIGFFGPKIKDHLGKEKFSMGLWFNHTLIVDLFRDNYFGLGAIRELLQKNSLSVFTLNAFPFGNFHDEIVKKSVYSPAWYQKERLDYTLDCAGILSELMEEDYGSISTLPLGWREDWSRTHFEKSTEKLLDCAVKLNGIREKTGKRIRLCLEPEPGCILETVSQVIEFWNDWLRPAAHNKKLDQQILNDHLGICYDTCHQAVQFENPIEVLAQLKESSIPIGKMQLSNALEFKPDPEKKSYSQRKSFAEKKFLHQTRIKTSQTLYRMDDLPEALDSSDYHWQHPWRIHYHLPLFAQDVMTSDFMDTTVQDMISAYRFVQKHNLCSHYEVETYTWSVLPKGLNPENDEALAEGIAREITYVEGLA